MHFWNRLLQTSWMYSTVYIEYENSQVRYVCNVFIVQISVRPVMDTLTGRLKQCTLKRLLLMLMSMSISRETSKLLDIAKSSPVFFRAGSEEEIMGIIGSSHRELGSNCNGDCSSKRDRFKDCTETSHGNWVCQKKKRGNPCRYADPNPGKWYCNDCNHKTSNTYCCKGCGFY